MKSIFAYSPLAIAIALNAVAPATKADLERLDDGDMSGISAQSGITLELGLKIRADSLSYFDDGNAMHLKGFKVGSSVTPGATSPMEVRIDIGSDASLNLTYLVSNRRIEFTDIMFSDSATRSMGGFFFDHSMIGTWKLKSGGHYGKSSGYTMDSSFILNDGRLGYRTNGNEIFLDGMQLVVDAPGATLDLNDKTLEYRLPTLKGSFDIAAIRYSKNPLNHGNSFDATSTTLLPSYGGLKGDFNLSTEFFLKAGGRFGSQGLNINSATNIKSANLSYVDDGNAVSLKGITGNINLTNFTVDVAPDSKGRQGLALLADRYKGNFNVQRVEMGSSGKSMGGLNFDFDFKEQTVNGKVYKNQVFIGAGGHPNAGLQGLRLATQWSLADANFRYLDDGNTIIFSGLKSWGEGDVLINVTKAGVLGGTEFFDGLRIGFDGVRGGYKLDGLRVGDDSKPLQGGTELLLALGFYPSYEFDLNGHITIGPGGASGSGLKINSDVRITNGRAALMVDEVGKGLWLSELDYDMHMRNMTVDVTSSGLSIIQGESWSTMDIGNLRIGSGSTGGSFGRFVLQRYEVGSSMTIAPGGASGSEGVTIQLKNIFAKAVSDAKRNRLEWETGRTSGNNSGTKLVLNDFYTSDGGGSNTFGIQNTLRVDVDRAKVVNKATGAVSSSLGFAVKAHTQIKELSVSNVDLVHPAGGAATMLYGVKIQNLDLKSNLTATPIQ